MDNNMERKEVELPPVFTLVAGRDKSLFPSSSWPLPCREYIDVRERQLRDALAEIERLKAEIECMKTQ